MPEPRPQPSSSAFWSGESRPSPGAQPPWCNRPPGKTSMARRSPRRWFCSCGLRQPLPASPTRLPEQQPNTSPTSHRIQITPSQEQEHQQAQPPIPQVCSPLPLQVQGISPWEQRRVYKQSVTSTFALPPSCVPLARPWLCRRLSYPRARTESVLAGQQVRMLFIDQIDEVEQDAGAFDS